MSQPRSKTLAPLAFLGLAAALLLAFAPPARAAPTSSPYGINIHVPQGTELTELLDRAQAAGIGWVRIDFVWAYVEPQPGTFDWSIYDAIAAAARARGLHVFATLAYTPGWATHGPDWTGVPDNPADWADVCFRAARRYQDTILYWGMWNEPNLAQFWSGSRQQYLDVILKTGADAVHTGNPAALVGGPELAHLTSADWFDWLKAAIDQAGDRLDFVTHHIYDRSGNRNVTHKLEDATIFGGNPGLWGVVTPSVKDVLVETGWFGRPFWLTETGWATDQVTEAQQAGYLSGLLGDWQSGLSHRDWVDKIFFYDIEDSPDPAQEKWGILRADGSAKPAYDAYASFTAAHTGGPPPPPPPIDAAHFVSATLPARIEAGETIQVSVTFENTGTSLWTAAAGYKLGAVGDSDPFSAPRQTLAAGESIAPGAIRTFTFAMKAPATPGAYTSDWRMLREGVAFFGETYTAPVTVAAAPPAAARTLPLLGHRFNVQVSWRDQHNDRAGFGRAIPGSDETGYFWFFDAASVELVVKLLDGSPVNGKLWAFYGALSDVEYWIDVTDTATGQVREYHNAPGNLCGGADTAAFAGTAGTTAAGLAGSAPPSTAPGSARPAPVLAPFPEIAPRAAAAAASCAPDARTLCLLAGRFAVTVDWRIARTGQSGTGTAVPGTDSSGYFWFFGPANLELVVKLLDGRPVDGHFWVFYGALSDVEYWVTVRDTATGASKRYHNAPGNLCGVGDTTAL